MSQPLPPPLPSSQPPQPSSNRTLMLVLSYLGILALIPLLVEKDDREVQWHAKHGLVMTVAAIVLMIALQIVFFVIAQLPVVGGIVGALLGCGVFPLLSLAIMAVFIIAMIKAVKGERLVIPFVTEYADKWR